MAFKNWNVRVHLATGSVSLGQVGEETEELARCAALSKFEITEDEEVDPGRAGIRSQDEFDVSPT